MDLLENFVVASIVVVCFAFSAWRLMSARMRLRLLDAVAAAIGAPADGWLTRARQRTLARLGGACGTCSQSKVHRP
ncbi:MAG TPA: hypothetical protein VJQ47_19100 [Steroidobacteraceae bacterium]|nr:hypothetical protein [Steroidobacteraceae bacterium]